MHVRITAEGDKVPCECPSVSDHEGEPLEDTEEPLTDLARRDDVITGTAEPAGELVD